MSGLSIRFLASVSRGLARSSPAGILPALAFLSFGAAPRAQTNAVPGLDVQLGALGPIQALGRDSEIFLAGTNGLAFETTACNPGSVTISWVNGDSTAPMGDDHPWISFLVAREAGGRLVQISDRSYAKSGFGVRAGNFCAECTGCGPGGQCSFLAPGCSDTYSVSTNGNSYYLAPPDEIDPFEVTWDPYGTQFDRGEPPVAPPEDHDGIRSLTQQMAQALGPVAHRVRVSDVELNEPAATYWYQGMYLVKGEPEANRENDLGSRELVATWTGSSWDLLATGALARGSVLGRWAGAALTSATNGPSDGRVYVAVKVSGPSAGLYHYEYALHDRDNARGVRAVHLPLCASAKLSGAGFHDVDDEPGNDWTFTRYGDELIVSTATNPLRWNSIYNLWFDTDAAPGPGPALLEAAAPGPGDPAFPVGTTVPGVMSVALVAAPPGLPDADLRARLLLPEGVGGALVLARLPAIPWSPALLPPEGGGLPADGLRVSLGSVLLCPSRPAVPIRR